MSLLKELEKRDLYHQSTDKDELDKKLESGPVTLYAGFDPTSDSLHIGSLLQILLLRRFQLMGHKPIALVGGGTGLIGDPSGKESERSLNTHDIVEEWTASIRSQLERFLDFSGQNAAVVGNNYGWLGNLNMIEFLRDIGKHFPVPYMLAKDSVKSRLETGISFTEFTYMILQSYDFLELHRREGCELQVGGSDQWGNITAGIDLVRRTMSRQVYGYTAPLVTKSDGSKFGKTESGTVWLAPEKTTPYQFYQFWINTDDTDAIRFLKYFTFLPLTDIAAIEDEIKNNPEKREAQRVLAKEVTAIVHGKEAPAKAEKISMALFYGNIRDLKSDEIREGFSDVPSHTIEGENPRPLVDLLVSAGVSPSKRQAREDLKNGAIYINGDRCNDTGRVLLTDDRLDSKYIVFRRGKKKYTLIKWNT